MELPLRINYDGWKNTFDNLDPTEDRYSVPLKVITRCHRDTLMGGKDDNMHVKVRTKKGSRCQSAGDICLKKGK